MVHQEWNIYISITVSTLLISVDNVIVDNTPHAHLTYAVVERSSVDGCYIIKPLKQKQFVHGLCYLLQEIYGIENKNTEKSKVM